jgi:hypothetical protein
VTNGGLTGPLSVPSSSSALAITQWQINAAGVTASQQVMLLVLRVDLTASPPRITVVGTDTETVTPPASASADVETFNVALPIQVQANDIIGQYAIGTTHGLGCYWSGVSGSGDDVEGLPQASAPTTGEQLNPMGSGVASNSSELNLGARLTPISYDAAVSLTAGPANAVSGQPALITATVTNNGPVAGPITFTDPVPSDLTVQAAGVGSGTCSTSTVNIVTCDVTGLGVHQSTNVEIVVTPTAAGTYTDSGAVTLAGGGTDPNPANNSSMTTLNVRRPGAPTACQVPRLGGASLALVKKLLPLLGCKVGKVKHATSKKVAKGDVISTSPGAGYYPVGKSVNLMVSSGTPKAKKHSWRRA